MEILFLFPKFFISLWRLISILVQRTALVSEENL